MDDEKRERRFQFSLRKLMLWMAVWAVYFAFLGRWAGTTLAAVIAAYLVTIAIIRLKWGLNPGWQIARVATAFGLGAFLPLRCLIRGGIDSAGPEVLGTYFAGCFLGFLTGLVAFGFVHGVVIFVDFLDLLSRSRLENGDAVDDTVTGTGRQDEPPAEVLKVQRRYQFSLRTLMLWMAVAAVYVSIMRWAESPTEYTLTIGLLVTVVVVVRYTLRPRLGFKTAVILSGCGLAGIVFVVYFPVALLASMVDKIDALLETKTPHATDTHLPDAASTED